MLAMDCDDRGLLVPYTCDSPVCPACCRRKSADRARRAVEAVETRSIRGADCRFITLTVRNVGRGELSTALDGLHDAWRAFRRKHPAWNEKVRGYLYNTEVTYSARSDGLCWHPHIHVVAHGDYWPQKELCEAWSGYCARRGLTACPKGSVRIEALRGEDLNRSLKEVCKYTLKPFEQAIESWAVIELISALQGDDESGIIRRRLRGACGSLELMPESKIPRWGLIGGVGWVLESEDSPIWTDESVFGALVSALQQNKAMAREIARHKGRVSHIVRHAMEGKKDGVDKTKCVGE